ncbi:MAG: glycosyltransferase [Roseiarcus sp.]
MLNVGRQNGLPWATIWLTARAERRPIGQNISMPKHRKFVLIYDNFGPPMVDRCEAIASAGAEVIALEIFGNSSDYEWNNPPGSIFKKVTLFPASACGHVPFRRVLIKLIIMTWAYRAATFLVCHYERPYIFIAAGFLRCIGVQVYVFMDSKFDDYQRLMWREVLKTLFVLPYNGSIVASPRSADYVRWLGMPVSRIWPGSCAISTDRIRRQRSTDVDVPFEDRAFVVIARLIEKKNIANCLVAYRRYCDVVKRPRALTICGSGRLAADLKAQAETLGIAATVRFLGFRQSEEISDLLSGALCLILPSSSEQFGIVVAEALALGVPVIASINCGARDELVRTGVNGFIIEPDNPDGLAFFMRFLGAHEKEWRAMRLATQKFAPLGDVSRLVESLDLAERK